MTNLRSAIFVAKNSTTKNYGQLALLKATPQTIVVIKKSPLNVRYGSQ